MLIKTRHSGSHNLQLLLFLQHGLNKLKFQSSIIYTTFTVTLKLTGVKALMVLKKPWLDQAAKQLFLFFRLL